MKKRLTICAVLIFGMFYGHISAYAAEQNKNIQPMLFVLFNSSSNSNIPDCNGDLGGQAYIDDCKICVGGNTGLSACECTYSRGNSYERICNYRNLNDEPIETRIDYSVSIVPGNTHEYISNTWKNLDTKEWESLSLLNMHVPGEYPRATYNRRFSGITTYAHNRVYIGTTGTSCEGIWREMGYKSENNIETWFPEGRNVGCGSATGEMWCSSHCSTPIPGSYDWVLSLTPTKLKTYAVGCHEWWDHYDAQGNWVECEE